MNEEQKGYVGKKLKNFRLELDLSQDDWARLFQVSPNTVARWERGELDSKGGNKKKVNQMIDISKNQRTRHAIKTALNSSGGLSAVAAFLGMLFGVMGCLKISLDMVEPLFTSESGVMRGIEAYRHYRHNELEG